MNTHLVIRKAPDLSVVRGAALIVLGALAIAFPVVASITASLVVAWVLIVAGFTHFVFAWRAVNNWSAFGMGFVGLMYVLAGVFMLANPLWGVASIAIVLGFLLMVDGVTGVLMYFTVDDTSRWVLVSACITVVLAAIIASGWLSYSLWMIGTLAGVNLMVRGAFTLAAWIEDERVSHHRAS
jgi:uncharacterized membrane protein HdeD (DUF308 family)